VFSFSTWKSEAGVLHISLGNAVADANADANANITFHFVAPYARLIVPCPHSPVVEVVA
jgi:hypothetical protein